MGELKLGGGLVSEARPGGGVQLPIPVVAPDAGESSRWPFEGEDRPREREAETVRLAELGALRDEELAALHESANEAKTSIAADRNASRVAR